MRRGLGGGGGGGGAPPPPPPPQPSFISYVSFSRTLALT
jgi:hypothetical protein